MMIHISIIGFGNHVKKNILPVLTQMANVTVEAVYVRNLDSAKIEMSSLGYDIQVKSVKDPIGSDENWIYIATPISTHYEYALKCLNLGLNVVCEKAISEDYNKAIELFSIAEENELSFVEVQMYKYHKQYRFLKNFLDESIKYAEAEFSIPKLAPEDIRYNKKLCGGALLDVGYYPISIFIDLFGEPKSTSHHIYGEAGRDVDTTGVMILDYGSFYCNAKWAIGKRYENSISIFKNESTIQFNRVFSKPADLVTGVTIEDCDGLQYIEIGSDNQFKNFFEEIFYNRLNKDIQAKTKLTLKLLADCYNNYYKSR
jgi:predicted dehydrogenase